MAKKGIEIPFGAFDSELGGFEYTIPEGYKAEIKDGKVVVRKTETEDEKIRKEIIATIHLYYGEPLENEAKEMIAWLENQGEQKPADKVEPKFKVGDIVKHKDNPHLTYILKRFTDDGDYEFHAIGKDGTEGATCFAVVKYQDEWELVEQNPAWSEEDCNQIETIACHLDNIGNRAMAESLLNIMDKYKSCRPQNRWKPTEEQIRVVNRLRHCFLSDVSGNDIVILDALLEQLKEL